MSDFCSPTERKGFPDLTQNRYSKSENWRAAVEKMNEVIPVILDVISFHQHSPALLGFPTRILKAEPGASRRRAILFGRKTEPNQYYISGNDVNKINELLAQDLEVFGPVLRWLRNACRPLPTWDRFVFAWLGLENLAGTRQVTNECPHCKRALQPFNASDREAAYGIVKSSDPAVTKNQFTEWWNRLRNSVFHGGKKPDSAFLGGLRRVSEVVLKAVSLHVSQKLGFDLESRPKIPMGQELVYTRQHFIEFDCEHPEEEFASAVPDTQQLEEILDRAGDTSVLTGTTSVGWAETDSW